MTATEQPRPDRAAPLASLRAALPFWGSLLLLPAVWAPAVWGGWWLLLPPVFAWYLFSALDAVLGVDPNNADPATPDTDLRWYTLITAAWVPLQAVNLYALIWYVAEAGHLSGWEKAGVFFGVGVMTGTIGANYAHELMHQRNRVERALADLLLAMILYGHFRSAHLLVHHRYVGTPADTVTARYNEGFHRFYPRVLAGSLRAALRAEARQLARKGLPARDRANPFWRYAALQALALTLAAGFGGWVGLGLFLIQAGVAIWQLELANYVEHYGLTRRHLGEGRYEHVKPHHSWNAAHKATNWLLINLQRHSDHHYKPDRRFPLLQTYPEETAPQLPYGYPLMTLCAMIPPLWLRMMNPRVRAWRQRYYPDIADWGPYKRFDLPMPR